MSNYIVGMVREDVSGDEWDFGPMTYVRFECAEDALDFVNECRFGDKLIGTKYEDCTAIYMWKEHYDEELNEYVLRQDDRCEIADYEMDKHVRG